MLLGRDAGGSVRATLTHQFNFGKGKQQWPALGQKQNQQIQNQPERINQIPFHLRAQAQALKRQGVNAIGSYS